MDLAEQRNIAIAFIQNNASHNDELNRWQNSLLKELLIRDEVLAEVIQIMVEKTSIQMDASAQRFSAHDTLEVTHSQLHNNQTVSSYIVLLLTIAKALLSATVV